jgi:hypothetical protein
MKKDKGSGGRWHRKLGGTRTGQELNPVGQFHHQLRRRHQNRCVGRLKLEKNLHANPNVRGRLPLLCWPRVERGFSLHQNVFGAELVGTGKFAERSELVELTARKCACHWKKPGARTRLEIHCRSTSRNGSKKRGSLRDLT